MTPETLADVTALLRMAHERLSDLETRSPSRLYVSRGDILARLVRLERVAVTDGMQERQGAPGAVDVSALVARLEGLEARLTAQADMLGELRAAPPAMAALVATVERLEHAGLHLGPAHQQAEHQGDGPELAALRERVAALESADTARRRRDMRLRARNDARAADALRRRKAVARIMDSLDPPEGWHYPTATAVHAVLADASAQVGEKPLALRTVRWHMAAVAADRAQKQRANSAKRHHTEARGGAV
jgi:hypothetical protein